MADAPVLGLKTAIDEASFNHWGKSKYSVKWGWTTVCGAAINGNPDLVAAHTLEGGHDDSRAYWDTMNIIYEASNRVFGSWDKDAASEFSLKIQSEFYEWLLVRLQEMRDNAEEATNYLVYRKMTGGGKNVLFQYSDSEMMSSIRYCSTTDDVIRLLSGVTAIYVDENGWDGKTTFNAPTVNSFDVDDWTTNAAISERIFGWLSSKTN